MTKRRTSSPYPYPPSDFVRHLTRVGWRRCDAEAIDVVRLALRNARNPNEVRSWAVRAGQALAQSAAFGLLLAAPEEHKRALARLFHGLRRAALD